MAETPRDPGTQSPPVGESEAEFRWGAFFQRSTEPIFVLNVRRQLLFVNRALETLTGLKGREIYKRVCKRQAGSAPGPVEALLQALAPTRDVMLGRPARVRRLVVPAGAAPAWWDVEFLPLGGPHGVLGIVGRIHPVATTRADVGQPLPDKLLALRQLSSAWWGLARLPASSPAMERIAQQVRLASRTRTPVLISGEPGSGKHWLARTIHQESAHRDDPFIILDCRHLPTAALAWFLFGSPSWASRSGATVYLQEPSFLARELQARLCELSTDDVEGSLAPRIIAGLSSAAEREVQEGRLLEEFHCLLSPLTIAVPPLRERPLDLPLLVERMLLRASHGRKAPVTGLAPDAWELIRTYGWPGNLRELYAVLAGGCRRAKGNELQPADLPWYLTGGAAQEQERVLPLDQLLEQVERRLMQLALVTARGNKSRAAELLQIPRARLLRRIAALKLED